MVDGINPFGGVNGSSEAVSRRLRGAYRLSDAPAAADSVQISSEVMRLRGVEGIRFDKVMAVRNAMRSGNYMTDEKLDVALDRALDHLFGAAGPVS